MLRKRIISLINIVDLNSWESNSWENKLVTKENLWKTLETLSNQSIKDKNKSIDNVKLDLLLRKEKRDNFRDKFSNLNDLFLQQTNSLNK